MRVLVTGAFGFVGRAVVRELLEAGHQVTAMTSRTGRAWSGPGSSAVTTVTADLLDPGSLAAAVSDTEAICHLAALTRVRESFDRPDEYAAVNAAGTESLIAAVAGRREPVPFVHASTSVVYGAPEQQPIDESCPPAPSSPYGITKLAADEALFKATLDGRAFGVSLRMFNVCGAIDGHGDPDLSRIIPKAVAVARGGFPELTVNGDGSAVRDYVHVKDVARAFALALAKAVPGEFEVYNIGATTATVAEIIDVTRQVTGQSIPVTHNPAAPEAPELRADTSKIRTSLGWVPVHSSLTEIITDAWNTES
jgi:UDP-glucose 4-epimerase